MKASFLDTHQAVQNPESQNTSGEHLGRSAPAACRYRVP